MCDSKVAIFRTTIKALQQTRIEKQKNETGTWLKSAAYSMFDFSTRDSRSATASASSDVKLLGRERVVGKCMKMMGDQEEFSFLYLMPVGVLLNNF